MAGAGTDGSDVVSDGEAGLYTFPIVVSWTSVTSHSIFESCGDRLTADQVISVMPNVAMPCCLLGINPARRNSCSFRLASGILCVSCCSIRQPTGWNRRAVV